MSDFVTMTPEEKRLNLQVGRCMTVLMAVRRFDETWYAALAGRAIAERQLGHDRSADDLDALCRDWRNIVDNLMETVDEASAWAEDELRPDPPVVIDWDGETFVVPESALPSWLTGRTPPSEGTS